MLTFRLSRCLLSELRFWYHIGIHYRRVGLAPDLLTRPRVLRQTGAALPEKGRGHRHMPIDWAIFLRILLAILRILQELPPSIDQRPIAGYLGDAIEANGIHAPKVDV